MNCHIGQELFSAAQQILAASLVTLMEVSLLLSDSRHVWPRWQPLMYVRAICWFMWRHSTLSLSTCVQPRPNWLLALYHGRQLLPPKLGQFLAITVTRAQYLVQWKDIVTVSIVFFERGWRGCGNGTGPCCTKRIIKTKQLWQVWNLRTLPGRREDYQSQAVCRRCGSLCALEDVMNRTENTDIDFYLWTQKPTLDGKALLKVAAIYGRRTKPSTNK